MKKLKVSLSMVVMLLVSGGVAWAAFLIDINGDPTQHQFLQGATGGNISVSTSSGTHTINWYGSLPVSKGGTGQKTLTSGQILFGDTTASMSSSTNLFWDNGNKFLGIGTKNPATSIDAKGTVTAYQVTTNSLVASGSNQSIWLSPTGTGRVLIGGDSIVVASKSSDPSPHTGQIYFNNNSNKFKGYNGSAWKDLEANTPGGRKFEVNTSSGGTLTTSLVAYWKMNEGASLSHNDVWDGHNLFQSNYPTQVDGKIGNAVSFTSANTQYLNAGNDKAFDNPTTFSVAFWINTGGQSAGAHKIISKEAEDGTGWIIMMAGSGGNVTHKIWLFLQDKNGNNLGEYGSTNLNDSQWHFVVVSRTGQTITMYVDGVAESLATSSSSGTIGDMSNNADFIIGRAAHASTQYFDGTLDEVGIWNKVLSSQEITDLCNGSPGACNGQTMVNN